MAQLNYRPDIDGMRAIAVCSVVAFHAGVGGLHGGFVGVDIFFVISGFLITGIMLEEFERGTFSLAAFYERRVRRILPALFAMMALVTVPAYYLLVPSGFEVFGKSAAAAALSFSNIYFWTQVSYFGVGSAQMPLLHTWSLAIEEQFYLVLPFYLMVLRRYRFRLTLLPVLLLSLPAGIALTKLAPSAAFYYPFGRMWELALGGMVATAAPRLAIQGRQHLREVAAWAGLVMVLLAIFTYTELTKLPGWAALLPCVGSALMIGASIGQPTTVGRLLAARPLVMIGLISYSLYLWHWPVLVLTRMALAEPPTPAQTAAMLVAILLLSLASWRFVEQPLRRARPRLTRGKLFAGAGFGIAAFAALGCLAWLSGGAAWRFSPAERQLALATDDINPHRKRCDGPSLERLERGDVCVLGTPSVPATVAIFGDSFADALMPAFEAAAREAGAALAVYVRSGCRPLVQVDHNPICLSHVAAMSAAIARDPIIHTVVLVGRWPQMTEGTRVGAVEQVNTYLTDAYTKEPSAAESLRAFDRSIARTVGSFGERRVFVVAHVPEQRVVVPQSAIARERLGLPAPRGVVRADFEAREHHAREALARARRELGFTVIDVGEAACDAHSCPVLADGRALYFDDNHPSRQGALRLSRLFEPLFAPSQARTAR